MRNIKLVLAYDGTNYHGFQTQKDTGLKTIQETLEKALTTLTQQEVEVIGSGRTDAGVHAQGQVVNFYSDTPIPAERFALAVNSLLPPDIIVRECMDVPDSFHSRVSAKKKTYQYTIYNDRNLSPFWRYYAYHVPVRLDADRMAEAAACFTGTHDFRGFCAKNAAVKSYVRTIFQCSVQKEGPLLRFTVEGSGFLWKMVRIMTGTLLEVGKGKRSVNDIPQLLQRGERKKAGLTVPPQGLCLMSVDYPPE